MLKTILDSGFAEITAVIHYATTVAANAPKKGQGTPAWVPNSIRRITDSFRATLEGKVGGCDPDAFAVHRELDLLGLIPRVCISHTPLESAADTVPADVEKIRALSMDVVIAMDDDVPTNHVRKLARYGVWSLSHVYNSSAHPDTAGFWEVFHKQPVIASILNVFPPDDDARQRTIGRALSAICTKSVKRTRNDLYWKGSMQLPRKLRELYLLGPDAFLSSKRDEGEDLLRYANRPPYTARLTTEIGLVSRIFWRIYSDRIRDLFVTARWILLFDFHDSFLPRLSALKKIVPPSDRFWADPHVVMQDGRYYVFFEELVYAQGKGHISVMEIREDGSHTSPRSVLERPYHLSNPVVFKHNGRFFMIPESSKNRTVDLYHCSSFPDEWQHSETLLGNIDAVDATIHFHRGKWWLFANVREYGSADDDLFLFSSDILQQGEWKSHPRNPIVSDVTRARPAGNIFEHEHRLYRPAQDCSIRYGYGIRIQEILTLTDSDYVEREAVFIAPVWDEKIIATHTFSRIGRLTMTDALQEERSERLQRRARARQSPRE